MIINEIRELIIRPALAITSLNNAGSENLMVMTLCIESEGIHLKQEKGPALGIFQIEPDTHKSIKETLNHYDNKALLERILAASLLMCLPTTHDPLIWNLRYACLIARMVYHRRKEPIPDANNIKALANYYCTYYNTSKGASTPERAYTLYMEMGNKDDKTGD